MPYHAVAAIAQALNRRKQAVNGSRILVLGIAYKKDIDDLRESPSLKLIELLQEQGAQVDYNDPYFERLHRMRKYNFPLQSVSLENRLGDYDCVVIATDHSSYDYERIVRESKLVADTRNATRHVKEYRDRIVLC
jgi:UDP-N-acetyl-D-glucosamine dehydrogenase